MSTPPSRNALRTLAAYAQVFDAEGFQVGDWRGGRPDENGVIQMPYMELSSDVSRFEADMYRVGLVHSFDWGAWLTTERGQALATDAHAVESASAEELASLLTAILRSERFGDGQIEGAFERGLIQAAARRAATLIAPGRTGG